MTSSHPSFQELLKFEFAREMLKQETQSSPTDFMTVYQEKQDAAYEKALVNTIFTMFLFLPVNG